MKKIVIAVICFSILFSVSCSKEETDSPSQQTSSVTTVTEISSTIETSTVTETVLTAQTTTSTENITDIDENSPANLVSLYSEETLPDFIKEIEWTQEMVVESEEEFLSYVQSCFDNMDKKICVIISGSCPEMTQDQNIGELDYGVIAESAHQCDLSNDGIRGVYAVIDVEYFTSTYVLDAYESGDTSQLDNAQLSVYEKAVDFIENTLDKSADKLYQEKQINDYICDITTYYKDESDYTIDNIPDFRSATGVFNNGSANCMGYTDAFYLLGTMAGFEVDKVKGDDAINHTWNTIVLDGKTYLVDVTWNDEGIKSFDGTSCTNYKYFNAPYDLACQEYTWEWYENDKMQSLVQTSDENYFYAQNSPDFGYLTNSADEFFEKTAQLIDSGEYDLYMCSKGEVPAWDTNTLVNSIFDRISTRGGSISASIDNSNGYTFFKIIFIP